MARRATEGFTSLPEIKKVMDLYSGVMGSVEKLYDPAEFDEGYDFSPPGYGTDKMTYTQPKPAKKRRPPTTRLHPAVMADVESPQAQYDWMNAYGRGVPAVGDLVSPDTMGEFVSQQRGVSAMDDLPPTGAEGGVVAYMEPDQPPYREGGRPRYDVTQFPTPPAWWGGGSLIDDGGNWAYAFHSPTGLPLFPIPVGLIHPADEYGFYEYDPETDMLLPDFSSVAGTEDDEFENQIFHDPVRVKKSFREEVEAELGPMTDEEWEEWLAEIENQGGGDSDFPEEPE